MNERLRRDASALLLPAIVALLPFGRWAELPVLLCALAGVHALLRGRIPAAAAATRIALIVFLAYWLPELFSAFDSVAAEKSWTEVAADLRFLPLLLFATIALRDARAVRIASLALAVVLAVWCADALLQAATGISLGGAAQADRLSGIFGDDNLKLGGVVAAIAPFGLLVAWHAGGARAALLAVVPILVVVLLAGARAAWVSLAVGCALVLWRELGRRRGSIALAALALCALLAGLIATELSPRFAERIDRTAAALRGDRAEIDHALSGRLPIWHTALAMSAAHPINGVGVRGFRYAYPRYADPDDPFVDASRSQGALHAHQLLLELSSETGVIGLLMWTLGVFAAGRAHRRAAAVARTRAAPAAYALIAMLFPLNTHYAVYSSFWSLLLFAMLALWIGALHARGDEA